MYIRNILYSLILLYTVPVMGQHVQALIRPGAVWNDDQGGPINAHGGGILYYNHIYYWYGEIKKGITYRVPEVNSWEDYRVEASGVSCYSSKDLLNWKYEGIALKPNLSDSNNDLHSSRVIERPKVLYNEKTKQFVMWMHLDNRDYSRARSGVAVSSSATGPFRFVRSYRPNGQMSRDMTAFRDKDGKAYLIYSSEDNLTMQICELTKDYLTPTSNYKRILINAHREAPALFMAKDKYFLITSFCSGWDPNQALYAEADQIMGEWKLKDSPCTGPDADSTYHAQSTYVFPIAGKTDQFVFMADRWNKSDLADSRYVWLPLVIENGRPVIKWKDEWAPGKSQ